MKMVDPETCGCARPEQHCEVSVPEAKFVGFTCKVGIFCCRVKRRPGPTDLKSIQKLIPKKFQGHLANFSQGLLHPKPKQPPTRLPHQPNHAGNQQSAQHNRQQFAQTRIPTEQNPIRNPQHFNNQDQGQNPQRRFPNPNAAQVHHHENNEQRLHPEHNQGINSGKPEVGRKPPSSPFYNPNKIKIEKIDDFKDDIKPHDLGLPKGEILI